MIPSNPTLTQFDHLPPHSLEAEASLLGCLLLCDGDPAIFASVRSSVNADSFYQADHQILYRVICELNDAGRKIDLVVMPAELAKRQLLEEIGGKTYLARLVNAVPSTAHHAEYTRIVREMAVLRGIIGIANDALRHAYGPTADDEAAATAMELAGRLSELANSGQSVSVHRLEDVVCDILDQKKRGEELRIATGIAELDKVIGGLRKGGKTIIGAKPGMGKSLLVKQLARNIAGRGIPFGIITVEETRHKIGENLLANESGIPNNRISFGHLSKNEWAETVGAAAKLGKLPIFIIDSARRLSSIVAAAHLLACRHKCQVIAVDHVHIIEADVALLVARAT